MLRISRTKRTAAAFMAFVLAALCLTVFINSPHIYAVDEDTKSGAAESEDYIRTIDDLKGKKIGVQLGTTGDIYVTDYEKDGTATVSRFNKAADAVQALKQSKIDCIVLDEQPAKAFVERNSDIKIIDEEFTLEDYALCVKKGNKGLLDKINTSLAKLKSDGTLEQIINSYIGTDDSKAEPYKKKDVTRSGKLTVATNAEFPPYEYMDNGVITGIDMDIMQAICDDIGMELKIENMKFDSIIASVNAGKADVGAAGMTVTEDRKKNVDFSESYTTSKQVIIIRKTVAENSEIVSDKDLSFIDKFKQNFIDQNRWRYLVDGLGTTLLITLLSIIVGLILGSL